SVRTVYRLGTGGPASRARAQGNATREPSGDTDGCPMSPPLTRIRGCPPASARITSRGLAAMPVSPPTITTPGPARRKTTRPDSWTRPTGRRLGDVVKSESASPAPPSARTVKIARTRGRTDTLHSPGVACQAEGTTRLPRAWDHLGLHGAGGRS